MENNKKNELNDESLKNVNGGIKISGGTTTCKTRFVCQTSGCNHEETKDGNALFNYALCPICKNMSLLGVELVSEGSGSLTF